MKTIWKFKIELGEFVLEVPKDFMVIKVANGLMWIEGSFHDINNKGVARTVIFTVVGTGHPVPEAFEYVGTYFEGTYVWHVYKERDA